MPNEDFVSRQWLIGEYHRRHEGPPGGALKMIEEAPAADVAPVKHGRWKEYQTMVGYYLECSYCGAKSNMDRMLYAYRYCPHCGAKMDKEEDDG